MMNASGGHAAADPLSSHGISSRLKGVRRLKVSIGSSNQPGKAAARLDGRNAPQSCQGVPFRSDVEAKAVR